jgi:hypothetical protein
MNYRILSPNVYNTIHDTYQRFVPSVVLVSYWSRRLR